MEYRAVPDHFGRVILALVAALAVAGCRQSERGGPSGQPAEKDKAAPTRTEAGKPTATASPAPVADKKDEDVEAPPDRGPKAQSNPPGKPPEESGKEHEAPCPEGKTDAGSERAGESSPMDGGEPVAKTPPIPEGTTAPKSGGGPSPPTAESRSPKSGATAPKQQEEAEDPDAFNLKELEESRKLIEQEMAKEAAQREKEQKRRILQLGPPLVDNAGDLVRLHKVFPIWTDPKGKRVVIVGEVCQRQVPLEMFACTRHTKEHEAIVVIDGPAQIVHAGLLAVGAKPGRPVQFRPKYAPATGQEIEVSVVWKDPQGKHHTARGQDWIRHVRSKKAMEYPWVFAGSGFRKDEFNGKVYYMADGGDFICVSNFATAMLDLPVESSSINQSLNYEAFTERIPEVGTPVTLILTPKPNKKPANSSGKSVVPKE